MTIRQIQRVIESVFKKYQKRVVPNPKTRGKTSKGNLAFNAFKYSWTIGENKLTFKAWIDEDVASYMVYTNEPWTAARWHGKKNPNEHWWERMCEDFIREVAARLGGKLK